MNSDIAVSCLDIKLGHLGPATVLGDHANDLIKSYVVHGELIWINTIENCLHVFVNWEAGLKGRDQQPCIVRPHGPSNHL